MSTVILKNAIERKPGMMYYIDSSGNVRETKLNRDGGKKGRHVCGSTKKKSVTGFAGNKLQTEFQVNYVKKDRMGMKKSIRGSVKTWVMAKDREEAIKQIKLDPEFGELISAKKATISMINKANAAAIKKMKSEGKRFFKKGDDLVNAEVDRINKSRIAQGMKPISKNRNSNSNKVLRQSMSRQANPKFYVAGRMPKNELTENPDADNSVTLKTFEKIIKKSKSFEDALKKVRAINTVPASTAQNFALKYNPRGNRTREEAFKNFYNEVKGDPDLPF